MNETSFLINTACGPIVNEKNLIEVLQNKKIARPELDVCDQKPISSDNTNLLELENVVLRSHITYKMEESLNRRVEVTIDNMINFHHRNNTNRVD